MSGRLVQFARDDMTRFAHHIHIIVLTQLIGTLLAFGCDSVLNILLTLRQITHKSSMLFFGQIGYKVSDGIITFTLRLLQ